MVIEVRLHDKLMRYAPSSNTGVLAVDVPDDISIKELIEELEIAQADIFSVKVNGAKKNKECRLADGDYVEFFPVLFA